MCIFITKYVGHTLLIELWGCNTNSKQSSHESTIKCHFLLQGNLTSFFTLFLFVCFSISFDQCNLYCTWGKLLALSFSKVQCFLSVVPCQATACMPLTSEILRDLHNVSETGVYMQSYCLYIIWLVQEHPTHTYKSQAGIDRHIELPLFDIDWLNNGSYPVSSQYEKCLHTLTHYICKSWFKAYILNVWIVGFFPVLAEKDEFTAYSIYSGNRKIH